jgi:hypothetical protein
MERRNKLTSFWCPGALKSTLLALARKEDIPLSMLIRRALHAITGNPASRLPGRPDGGRSGQRVIIGIGVDEVIELQY